MKYFINRVTDFKGLGCATVVIKGMDYTKTIKKRKIMLITDKNIIEEVRQYLHGDIPLPDYLEITSPIDPDNQERFQKEFGEIIKHIDAKEDITQTLPVVDINNFIIINNE